MTSSSVPVRIARSHIQMYASGPAAPIHWRLLGGNNRELGRGTGEFEDEQSCRLGIDNLKRVVGELQISLRRGETGTWGWLLSLGGVSVATSGFRYDRQIRCRLGLDQFVDALDACEIGANPVYTHSRRWTSMNRAHPVRVTRTAQS